MAAARDDFVILLIFISFLFCAARSAKSPSYYYDQCAPSDCGDSILQFPFGLNPPCRTAILSSSCEDGSVYLTSEGAPRRKYRVLDTLTSSVYDGGIFTLVDVSLLGCGPIDSSIGNSDGQKWLMESNFLVTSNYKTGTFFNCTNPPEADMLAKLREAPCLDCGNSSNFCYYYDGYMDGISNYCTAISVALETDLLVNNFTKDGNLRRKLQEGFQIQWKSTCGTACMNSTGGRCGFSDEVKSEGSEMCFCASSVHKTSCFDGIIISLGGGKSGKKTLIAAGLGAGSASVMLGIICFAYVWRRNLTKKKLELIRGQDEAALRRYLKDKKAPASIETFLENYACEMPTRFSYKEIKKYSNNFSEKLGQGGFGSVFKATLPNGFVVAVKLLDETKQSDAQFLNEVGTVGKIHHNNLVRLLGFCFEKSKRALVYEFMENGSLEKYIHRKNRKLPEAERLSWNQLYDIALGTARGIAYLHEECQIRILHFDIKPHNILLDRKFQPKVSDFGLAQLVNREHSHVTLSGGRGTPGYAPPEMWWENYGPVTEKSDVYSFGMVILEMVGGRRNFDADASRPSEMYFPEWVYRHHVLHKGGGSFSTSDATISCSQDHTHGGREEEEEEDEEEEEEKRITRMLAIVGLWCIQSSPTKRPSMRKVVQMLEGTVAIEVPPVPFDAAISQLGTDL